MSGYTDWLASLVGTTSSTFTAHKTRHQNGGADEISITGLSGVPSLLNNIVCFEDTIVSHEDNIVENEV